MTKMLRTFLTLSVVLFLGAIAFFVIYKYLVPELPLLQNNTQFRSSVDAITDPNHLRKLVYGLVRDTDKALVATKNAMDAAVYALIAVMLSSAATFAWAYFSLKRLIKKGNDVS
jgi:hypothetical protein